MATGIDGFIQDVQELARQYGVQLVATFSPMGVPQLWVWTGGVGRNASLEDEPGSFLAKPGQSMPVMPPKALTALAFYGNPANYEPAIAATHTPGVIGEHPLGFRVLRENPAGAAAREAIAGLAVDTAGSETEDDDLDDGEEHWMDEAADLIGE